MRISDWSSDVCSSDLGHEKVENLAQQVVVVLDDDDPDGVRSGACVGHHPSAASSSPGIAGMAAAAGRVSTKMLPPPSRAWQTVSPPCAAAIMRTRCSPSPAPARSEEHTSELQSLMRHSYAVYSL